MEIDSAVRPTPSTLLATPAVSPPTTPSRLNEAVDYASPEAFGAHCNENVLESPPCIACDHS